MSNVPRNQSHDSTVTFTHQSAFNQIVEPTKFVSLTHYFIAHWLPKISPNGLRILITLRSMGYFNPQSGEKRGEIDIDQDELAALIGISPKTIQRAFADDLVLNKYVRRVFSVQRDRAGRIVKEHYVYVVTMDDVLTSEDQARYEHMVLGPEKGSANVENPPERQLVSSDAEPKRQVDASDGQCVLPKRQNDAPKRQSVSPYKVNLTLTTKNTLTTPAAGSDSSLTLFSGEDPEPVPNLEALPVASTPEPLFVDLTDADRAPWLDKAEAELKENFGLAVWQKTKEKAKASIRAQRAANLYLQSFDLAARSSR